MATRQGGKAKPLKAPKKDKKELDEDDLAFKERKKQEEAALKAAKDKAAKGKLVGNGLLPMTLTLTTVSEQEAHLVEVSRSLARSDTRQPRIPISSNVYPPCVSQSLPS
ncbi:TMA7-domain-containing protein, partial [Laetiporus sulphureus 93-53]